MANITKIDGYDIKDAFAQKGLVFYEEPTGTAGSGSSPYLSTKWQLENVEGTITTPYNGMRMIVKVPTAGVGTAGVILSIDNGQTWHPVRYNNSTLTTHYSVGTVVLVVYDSTTSQTAYPTAGTSESITGVWRCVADYDSNTTNIANILKPGGTSLLKTQLGRYRLMLTVDGTTVLPFNDTNYTNATTARAVTQEKFDPFGDIYFYNTSTVRAANYALAASAMNLQYYSSSASLIGYSYVTTLTANKWIFLKATMQSDGTAILNNDTNTGGPIVQDLPTTDDGFIYIFLGYATSATLFTLHLKHPIFYYKDGKVRLFTNGGALSTKDALGNISATGTMTDSATTPASGDYLITRNASTNEVQTSNIDADDVATTISKAHTHVNIELSTTAQDYDGKGHTIKLPASSPYPDINYYHSTPNPVWSGTDGTTFKAANNGGNGCPDLEFTLPNASTTQKGVTLLGATGGAATYARVEELAQQISGAMHFEGTIGTGGTSTTVPANPSQGDTYIIIAGGESLTFPGITDTINVGDTVVYKDATTQWVLIPSGDEGTVTSITAGTGLTGGTITTSGTIAHSDIETTTAVSTAGVKKITTDGLGHIITTADVAVSDLPVPTETAIDENDELIFYDNSDTATRIKRSTLKFGDTSAESKEKALSMAGTWEKFVPAITYEWNKQLAFGSSGKLCIGKFCTYDTNITIDIDSTTSTTYHGTLVIATQNHGTSSSSTAYGTFKACVYGDASNTIAPNIFIYNHYGRDALTEVYFKPLSWSKNVVHIRAVALANQGTVTYPKLYSDIMTNVSAIPEEATLQPTNELTRVFPVYSHHHTATATVPSEDIKLKFSGSSLTSTGSTDTGTTGSATTGITINSYTPSGSVSIGAGTNASNLLTSSVAPTATQVLTSAAIAANAVVNDWTSKYMHVGLSGGSVTLASGSTGDVTVATGALATTAEVSLSTHTHTLTPPTITLTSNTTSTDGINYVSDVTAVTSANNALASASVSNGVLTFAAGTFATGVNTTKTNYLHVSSTGGSVGAASGSDTVAKTLTTTKLSATHTNPTITISANDTSADGVVFVQSVSKNSSAISADGNKAWTDTFASQPTLSRETAIKTLGTASFTGDAATLTVTDNGHTHSIPALNVSVTGTPAGTISADGTTTTFSTGKAGNVSITTGTAIA